MTPRDEATVAFLEAITRVVREIDSMPDDDRTTDRFAARLGHHLDELKKVLPERAAQRLIQIHALFLLELQS